MAEHEIAAAWRDFHSLFDPECLARLSDAELLAELARTFSPGRDKTDPRSQALAILIQRHGGMVLGVCRRVLVDANDVADAFQATFLILVQKAASLRIDHSLGPWLHSVSRRVAQRIRTQKAARLRLETGSAEVLPDPRTLESSLENRELGAVLDAEINRLPPVFRDAIILCELAGLSHERAASQIGCPVGTIESRLSRGRARLRSALARRGFAPSILIWPKPGTLVEVAPSLIQATTAPLNPAAEPVTRLSPLIQGVLSEMFAQKIKSILISAGAALLLFGTLAAYAQRPRPNTQEPQPPTVAPATPATQREEIVLQPPAKIRPGDILMVELLEALPGRPITGQRLVRPDGTISLGFYGDLQVAGLDRYEIKTKLIKHMLFYLTDQALGLERLDETGKVVPCPPLDSDRIFVDDSFNYNADLNPTHTGRSQTDSEKLDSLLSAVHKLQRDLASPDTKPNSARPALKDQSQRIKELEDKVERLARELNQRNPQAQDKKSPAPANP